MRKLLIILIGCSLLGGCATTKRTSKTEEKTQQQTAVREETQENASKQTLAYGDTLKGNSFVPADDPEPTTLTAESNGVKIKLKLKPKRDQDGKLKGFDAEYETTAKPVTIINENLTSTTTTQAQQSTQSKAKVSEITKDKRGSVLTWSLAGATLVLIILLLIMCRFR